MASAPRLRQVALVSADLERATAVLQQLLQLPHPHRDPGVLAFGLDNAVFAVGDTFLEVVAPVVEGTTAGRYLARRGGDAGYMAIFQVHDVDAARRRVDELGVRTVWQADLPEIAGTHLHPRDVPGAIVSLDEPRPAESWHWAGPAWTGAAPHDREAGGITSLTVGSPEPVTLARRWAEVLGVDAAGQEVRIADGAQVLRFVDHEDEGILAVGVARPGAALGGSVCGVRFEVEHQEGG